MHILIIFIITLQLLYLFISVVKIVAIMIEDAFSTSSFHIVDYIIFFAFLAVSMGIGVYFAITGRRRQTTEEFLTGSRKLKVIPVTLSLLVSFVSSIGEGTLHTIFTVFTVINIEEYVENIKLDICV